MPKIDLHYSNLDGTMQYDVNLDIGAFGDHDLHSAHIDVPGVASWDEPDKQSLLKTLGTGIFNAAASLAAIQKGGAIGDAPKPE
jgi:hypothetical protein